MFSCTKYLKTTGIKHAELFYFSSIAYAHCDPLAVEILQQILHIPAGRVPMIPRLGKNKINLALDDKSS